MSTSPVNDVGNNLLPAFAPMQVTNAILTAVAGTAIGVVPTLSHGGHKHNNNELIDISIVCTF